MCYELNDANQLTVTYESSNDAPTLCNPTNHAYFNLSDDNKVDKRHEVVVKIRDIIAEEFDNGRVTIYGDEELVKLIKEIDSEFYNGIK